MKYSWLLLLLVGCAGSPTVHITKNFYIMDNKGNVTANYITTSAVDVNAEIEQQIRDLLKAPTPGG